MCCQQLGVKALPGMNVHVRSQPATCLDSMFQRHIDLCYCIGTDGDTLANRLILCPLQQQQIIRASGDSYCAISGGEQDSFRRANHKRSQHTCRRAIGLKVWLGSRTGRIDNHPSRHRHHAVAIAQHNVNRWWQRNGRRNCWSDDPFRRIMVTSSPQKEHSRKPAQHRHKARLSDSARRKENYGAASPVAKSIET